MVAQQLKAQFANIQKASTKEDKIKFIKEYSVDDTFKLALYNLLSPNAVFGISEKKINKKLPEWMVYENLDWGFKLLYDWLNNNNTGNDETIGVVQGFIIRQTLNIKDETEKKETQEFLKQLITKKFKLDCNAKTVNQAIPMLIEDFQVQLAEKYFEHPEKVIGKSFTITTKLDGVRCLAVKDNGIVSIYSRQGKKIEHLTEVENELNSMSADNFVFDGELLIHDRSSLVSKEQYKKTMEIVGTDGLKKGIDFMVFDCLPLKDFSNNECSYDYLTRRVLMNTIFTKFSKPTTFVKLLPILYSGDDVKVIPVLLEEQRKNGEEGIMINLNEGIYEFKRTYNLLKVKVMQDCDLEIIDYEEGKGKLKGTLGSLIVDYKGSPVKVGSGFDLDTRKDLWYNKDMLKGKIITVQYFEETENKKGVKSLRFPVFLRFREDKKEPSYN